MFRPAASPGGHPLTGQMHVCLAEAVGPGDSEMHSRWIIFVRPHGPHLWEMAEWCGIRLPLPSFEMMYEDGRVALDVSRPEALTSLEFPSLSNQHAGKNGHNPCN